MALSNGLYEPTRLPDIERDPVRFQRDVELALGSKLEDIGNWHIINVKDDFGAVGDGLTDDTIAIQAAWDFVQDSADNANRYYWGAGTGAPAPAATNAAILYFPPGHYVYTGDALTRPSPNAKTFAILGTPKATRITVRNSDYFLDYGDPRELFISGITFYGDDALGFIKISNAGAITGVNHYIRDCQFFNYSECAIGSVATDWPQVEISGCYFQCKDNSSNAKSICMGGLVDQVWIYNCHFYLNVYDIHIDGCGGNIKIGPNNSFLKQTNNITKKADIWLSGRSGTDNSGQGTEIFGNKFGNENLLTNQPRILFASEDTGSGSDRLTYAHSTSDDTTNYLIGLQIHDNTFQGTGNITAGLIQTYLRRIQMVFERSNIMKATPHPYLIENVGTFTTWEGHSGADGSYIEAPLMQSINQNAPGIQLSNTPGFASPIDPHKVFSGSGTRHGFQRDPKFRLLRARQGNDMSVTGGSSRTRWTDAWGSSAAAEYTFGANTHEIQFINVSASIGEHTWLDIELKKADTQPLNTVMIYSRRNDSSKRREISRPITLTDNWQRVTVPGVFSEEGGPQRIVITPVSFAGGSKDKVVVGRCGLYHAAGEMDNWQLEGSRAYTVNASVSLVNGEDMTVQLLTATLSADSQVYLDFDNAVPPMYYKFYYSGGGSNKWTIRDSGGTLTELSAGNPSAHVIFNGDNGWSLCG